MSFSVTIQPYETVQVYGVNSTNGFTIESNTKLSSEVKTITAILGAFIELSIAQNNMAVREPKFQKYVAWKPKEEWAEEGEYQLYKSATARLNRAHQSLANIKATHQVTSIVAFQ
jgi:hypothetical protein